jgi:hypothetical protein
MSNLYFTVYTHGPYTIILDVKKYDKKPHDTKELKHFRVFEKAQEYALNCITDNLAFLGRAHANLKSTDTKIRSLSGEQLVRRLEKLEKAYLETLKKEDLENLL